MLVGMTPCKHPVFKVTERRATSRKMHSICLYPASHSMNNSCQESTCIHGWSRSHIHTLPFGARCSDASSAKYTSKFAHVFMTVSWHGTCLRNMRYLIFLKDDVCVLAFGERGSPRRGFLASERGQLCSRVGSEG